MFDHNGEVSADAEKFTVVVSHDDDDIRFKVGCAGDWARQPPPPPRVVARNRGWDALPDGGVAAGDGGNGGDGIGRSSYEQAASGGGGEGDCGGSGGPATPALGEVFGGRGGSGVAGRSLADGLTPTTCFPSSGALRSHAATPAAAAIATAAEGEVSPLATTAAGGPGARFDVNDCEECYEGCRCTAHVLWGRDKVALWNSSDYRSRWFKGIEAVLSQPGEYGYE